MVFDLKKDLRIFRKGLETGLFLQLALGPVFFFIMNLTLQKTVYDGFAAVFAVTLGDYFYITLSVFGVGRILEKKKVKKIFKTFSSLLLILVGLMIAYGVFMGGTSTTNYNNSSNVISSFFYVLILTISNPMTIIFFTSIFTAKSIENNFNKRQLYIFGLSVGSATFIFMGFSVIVFSVIRENMPLSLIQTLNLLVGVVLIGYGIKLNLRVEH